MAAPFTLDHLEVRVSASVGIAVASGPGHRAAEVLASADAALYRAKEHGRDRYELDADVAATEPDRARLQLRLGADLHRVLDRDELTLYYQPVLTTSSRRPVAVEALLRWRQSEPAAPASRARAETRPPGAPPPERTAERMAGPQALSASGRARGAGPAVGRTGSARVGTYG